MTSEIKKKQDKDKLLLAMSKAVKTTMIGALAAVEEQFGELWGHNENRELTKDEQTLYESFLILRNKILDNGNIQLKALKSYSEKFEVVDVGYTIHLVLPVRKE